MLLAAACLLLSAGAALSLPSSTAPPPGGSGGGASTDPVRPMVLSRSVDEMLAVRIARQLVEASPPADPSDAAERDRAAARLGACRDLIDAAQGRILWGGFNPDQGYDPRAYRLDPDSPIEYFQLTEFEPSVWARLYLSTFMFPGTYEVRQEGNVVVLALDAQFRSDLLPGDYPYPFWHSPNKWTAYVNARKVLLIFRSGRLVASMRQSPPPEALNLIRRRWDAQWSWTDEAGLPQPRVALFSYLFSEDNPHVAALDASYRALEEQFRAQNCVLCHEPDNRSRINDLLLLGYPNQALVMRRTLVTVLEANEMPPGSSLAHAKPGLRDSAVQQELVRLARIFERDADAAMAYEQLKRASRPLQDD